MANKNAKRVSLYFNLEDEQDMKRWEFIGAWSSKSAIIKKLIDDAINGATVTYSKPQQVSIPEEPKNNNDLKVDEIDSDGIDV